MMLVHTASASGAGPERVPGARLHAGLQRAMTATRSPVLAWLPRAVLLRARQAWLGAAATSGAEEGKILFRKHLQLHHRQIMSVVNIIYYHSADTRKYGNTGFFQLNFPFDISF